MTEIELRLGDCLDVLKSYPDGHFHALITDPPFTAAGGSTNGRSGGAIADSQFFVYWMQAVFSEIRRVVVPSACGFVFCDWRTIGAVERSVAPDGNRQTEDAWKVSQALVWDRDGMGLGSPFRNGFEMIAFARGPAYKSGLPKTIRNVIPFRWPYGRHDHHGAEKPVGLLRQLIEWAEIPAGGRVLDPFAGSGSTLVACSEMGLSATGIELELGTYETAHRRLAPAGVVADPAVRAVRLAAGRCPECGSEVEWRLTGSRPGASAQAACMWSGRAFLRHQQALELESGRNCPWVGRVVRGEHGSAHLADGGTP